MPAETPRYKYSLRGQDALAWLAERDMCGEDVGDSEIRLVADEIVLPDLRMARLWHTAASYSIARTSPAALLLLQIEGTCTIDSDEWNEPAELGPGDAAVLPGGTRFLLSSESTTARYELDYELDVLPPAAREELARGKILVAPAREYRDAVAATSNAALNSGMSLRDAGFSDFAAGVRHLTTALLLQALETSSPWLLTSTSALHRSAMRVIAARAADPDFDVESLAAAVRTSPRNLRHVFAQAGTTAKVALTAERVRLARQNLARRAEGRPSLAPRSPASPGSETCVLCAGRSRSSRMRGRRRTTASAESPRRTDRVAASVYRNGLRRPSPARRSPRGSDPPDLGDRRGQAATRAFDCASSATERSRASVCSDAWATMTSSASAERAKSAA